MTIAFGKATRKKARLRLGLCGPSGAGKTYTGLRLAFALAAARGAEHNRPGRVAVIDSENGSASKYCGENPDGFAWDFDVCELTSFSPSEYTQAIQAAARAGFDVLLVDGLSQAWDGKDGALELVDKKKGGSGNSFTAWKDVTPLHRRMIEAILTSPCDVICTLRAKTEHVLVANDKGKLEPRKVGMGAIQRQGMEYEFDIFCELDDTHILTVTKTRCAPLDGVSCVRPGPGFLAPVIAWLTTGEVVEPTQPVVRLDDRKSILPLLQKIMEDAARIGWSRAKLDEDILENFSVKSLDDLGAADLQTLSGRLARLPAKRAPQPTPQPTPQPARQTPASPATTVPATPVPGSPAHDPSLVEHMDMPPKKVTREQLLQVKALQETLFGLLVGKQQDKNARWKQLLGKRGVDSATKLSEEGAILFCKSLEHEIGLLREGDPLGGDKLAETAAEKAPAGPARPDAA